MTKPYQLSLFIFRRDLRLNDNTGLLHALQQSEQVIPCFIFDPRQVDSTKNNYHSSNAVEFMLQCLQDLDQHLCKKKSKLYLFEGDAKKSIANLIKVADSSNKCNTLFFNYLLVKNLKRG